MNRRTISLPEELDEVVEREARRRHCSVSALAREALEAHLGLGSRAGQVPSLDFLVEGDGSDLARHVDEILAESWADAIMRDSDSSAA